MSIDLVIARRIPGAVVRYLDKSDYIVKGRYTDGGIKVAKLDGSPSTKERLNESTDVFQRWATPNECERHGILYVDRTLVQNGVEKEFDGMAEHSKAMAAIDAYPIERIKAMTVVSAFIDGWLARAMSGREKCETCGSDDPHNRNEGTCTNPFHSPRREGERR